MITGTALLQYAYFKVTIVRIKVQHDKHNIVQYNN